MMWSIAGLFIKMIPWHPLVISGFRSLIAAAVLAAYMAVSGTRFRWNRTSLLSGIVLSLTFFSFVTANKLTTSANAIVLQFTAPIFIVILSTVFYKQRYRREDYLVVVITLLGVALCFSGEMGGGSLAGNLIAVFSGLTFGTMFVVAGNTDNDSRMSGILIGHLITALVGAPLCLVFPTGFGKVEIINILILGVVQLGIPYILYGLALNGCPPLACCLISVIEPLLNPIWVFLFNGERPGILSFVGELIVITTVTAWTVRSSRQSSAAEEASSETE